MNAMKKRAEYTACIRLLMKHKTRPPFPVSKKWVMLFLATDLGYPFLLLFFTFFKKILNQRGLLKMSSRTLIQRFWVSLCEIKPLWTLSFETPPPEAATSESRTDSGENWGGKHAPHSKWSRSIDCKSLHCFFILRTFFRYVCWRACRLLNNHIDISSPEMFNQDPLRLILGGWMGSSLSF